MAGIGKRKLSTTSEVRQDLCDEKLYARWIFSRDYKISQYSRDDPVPRLSQNSLPYAGIYLETSSTVRREEPVQREERREQG